jgi:hypothetical protein
MTAAAMRVAACACPRDLRIKPEVLVESGQVWAVITDNRPDEPLGRFRVPQGAMIYVRACSALALAKYTGRVTRPN